jgi:hypothetical protein
MYLHRPEEPNRVGCLVWPSILYKIPLTFIYLFIQCLFSCVADHMIENTCRLVICLYDVYGALVCLDCSFVTEVSKHYY